MERLRAQRPFFVSHFGAAFAGPDSFENSLNALCLRDRRLLFFLDSSAMTQINMEGAVDALGMFAPSEHPFYIQRCSRLVHFIDGHFGRATVRSSEFPGVIFCANKAFGEASL